MTHTIKLLIDGMEVEGAGHDVIEVVNPATETPVAQVSLAAAADLDRALRSSSEAYELWRKTSAAERAVRIHAVATLLRERVERIAQVLTQEQGKPLPQARWEIRATAAYFDDLAGWAQHVFDRVTPREPSGVSRTIRHEPVGPVFAVTPWNLPAMLPGRKIATALAAGCSIILKPAKETPQTAYLIGQCCLDAGIPRGVVNIVSGPADLISETLIHSSVIRKISFTGSTEVGRQLAQLAGAAMKKSTMELGGHAPVLICKGVDVNRVTEITVPARYANAGQSCISATRFFVHQSLYENFVSAFSRRAAALRVGNGMEEGIDMGPLASARRLPVMQRLVADACARGASLTAGGELIDGAGYFFQPTVLRDVPDDAAIMHEEPFGPVTPIVSFTDTEEVIARANATPYGLASYIFSADPVEADALAAGLDVGMVGINSIDVAAPAVPFGGVRASGFGREGSIEGILESMVTKTVSRGG